MKNPLNVVAGIGLALGGVFGMIGTVVTQRNLQAASWGIDGVGLVGHGPARREIFQKWK